MSVHYKFKSALEYDTVTFDGLHISVKDLKNSIIQQKRIGKSTDFDLQVTNAQTKEVYEDENALIPKNTSLLIARIPVIPQKPKQWEGYGGDNTLPVKLDEGGPIAKAVDLSSLDAPEDDKIRAMIYMKIRGANQMGTVPPTYKCYKCHQGGHWIKDCTFGQGAKSTGIPRSFMVAVDGPQVPGAMMTPYGQFAVPLVDHQAYNHKAGAPQPVPEPKPDIPEDLVCGICSDLLQDAVMIPCCGNSFCDECVRGVLLESEEHECPDCHEKDIFPDTLIPNSYMKIRGANQMGTVPPTYKCYKCHQGGHWIKDCTFGQGAKSTGIPRSFMVAVDGPQVPGAMMTPYGQFAVPLVDHQAYNHKAGAPQPVPEPKPDIPEDLVCGICSDLLQDAVMIPCCGNSFCDECVRGVLLESEEHECPDCHEKDIFPDTLIPNR
ncbi:unnamed protein product [Phaedon cochleariae]|uniref:Uncharacterized protein n=1 Tax=Phaedon cochleariae TaxID=80249 RepID=A0A9N9SIG5_PHACE|nr:unnamed protein product [Phaedon cochleariae]